MTETPKAAVILDVHGKPARLVLTAACPRCSAGADKRIASCGFGTPKPCCGLCGYVWEDEVFRGEAV